MQLNGWRGGAWRYLCMPPTPYLLVQPPVEPMNYLPSYVQSTFQSGGTSQFDQLGDSKAISARLHMLLHPP